MTGHCWIYRSVWLMGLTILSGCSPYALRGKVVPSANKLSAIVVVEADDPRLDWPGMGTTRIRATIDPDRLSRQDAGQTQADFDGWFSLPIDQAGAGLLEYDVLIVGQLKGYASASQKMSLPASDKRVLILLAPGDHRYTPPYDDIVNETLKLSEPYRKR